MNFLAHLYLSDNVPDLLVGNFIADAVKGNRFSTFPEGISTGIRLHRQIDTYTDTHPLVSRSKARLSPHYGKYSAVIVDLYYDHFLAANWDRYSERPLSWFARYCYNTIEKYREYLPERMDITFHYMQKHNWLESYKDIEGISRALQGMSQRTSFTSHMEKAGYDLVKDYELYKEEFSTFFPQLEDFVRRFLEQLER